MLLSTLVSDSANARACSSQASTLPLEAISTSNMSLSLVFDSRVSLPPAFAARAGQLQGAIFIRLSSTSYQFGDVFLQYGTLADGRTAWAVQIGGMTDVIFEPTDQHLVCTDGNARHQRWFAVRGKSTIELSAFGFVQAQCEEDTLLDLNRAVKHVLRGGKSECYEGFEKRLDSFLNSAASNTDAVNTALKTHAEENQKTIRSLTQTLAVRFAADDAKMAAIPRQIVSELEHKVQMSLLQSNGEMQQMCIAQLAVAED
jgi:hypothetical protein